MVKLVLKLHYRCLESGHGCPKVVKLILRPYYRYSKVMKLILRLHLVSQGGHKREFQSGEASVWASPQKSWSREANDWASL